jgi:hypothetical protein
LPLRGDDPLASAHAAQARAAHQPRYPLAGNMHTLFSEFGTNARTCRANACRWRGCVPIDRDWTLTTLRLSAHKCSSGRSRQNTDPCPPLQIIQRDLNQIFRVGKEC